MNKFKGQRTFMFERVDKRESFSSKLTYDGFLAAFTVVESGTDSTGKLPELHVKSRSTGRYYNVTYIK